MTRRKAELNISSYNFWNLDETKPIHIAHEQLNFSNRTMLYTPHRIPHFVIRWVKSGSGNVTVDHIDYEIKRDILFIGHPDQIRLFDVDQNIEFDTIFVAFTNEILALMNILDGVESIIGTISKQPIMKLKEKNKDIIENIFSLLLKVRGFESSHQNKMIASLLQLLIMTIAEINSTFQVKLPVRKQTYLNLYREFLKQLNESYKKYHFTSDYADMMFIPLKRLNRACKSVTGKTAGKIISDRLDFEAKRYLYYSTNTIKEISYELGL